MKKLFYVLVMVCALLFSMNGVKAMSEEDFIAYVTKVQNINGKQIEFMSKAEVQRYLKMNDLSEDDLSIIKEKYDEGLELLRETGATSYKDLSEADRTKLENVAKEAGDATGVKFTVNSNKSVTLYNLDGTVFAEETPKIKQTGSSNYEYLVIPALAVVAIATTIIVRKKQNA